MRRGRKHNQCIGLIRKELRQLLSLGMLTSFGNIVGFIDDDNIPPCVLQMGAVVQVILQRIHGNDGLVIVIERIVVRRYPRTDPLYLA